MMELHVYPLEHEIRILYFLHLTKSPKVSCYTVHSWLNLYSVCTIHVITLAEYLK